MPSFLQSIFKPSVDHLEKKRDVAGLVKVLEKGNSMARAQAVDALARIGGEAAIMGLIEALKDSDPTIEIKAIEALGKVGNDRAVGPLVDALASDNPKIWLAAHDAIYHLKSDNIDPLLAALSHHDRRGRANAAGLLGLIGDKRAAEPLAALLKGRDATLRKAAAIALGQLKDRRAVQPLIKLLKDDGDRLAAMLLGELGDKAAVEPLIMALDNDQTRDYAVQSLGTLGDIRAVLPLVAVTRQHPPRSTTHYKCLEALETLAKSDPAGRELVDQELGEPCELCGTKSAFRYAVEIAQLTTAIQKHRLPTEEMLNHALRGGWVGSYSTQETVNEWCYALTRRTQPPLCCLACKQLILHWEEYPVQQFE
jgi:HEAT repeat protein